MEIKPDDIENAQYAAGGGGLSVFLFWLALQIRKLLRIDSKEATIETSYKEVIAEMRIQTATMREELRLSRDEIMLLRESVAAMEVTVNSCKQEREALTARVEAFEQKYGQRRTDTTV